MSKGFENTKSAEERDFMTCGIFGHKAQGKTTWVAEEFVKPYYEAIKAEKLAGLRKEERRVLIYDPSGEGWAYRQFEEITVEELEHGKLLPQTGMKHHWRTGIRVIRENLDDETVLRVIRNNVRNALVVLDECPDWMNSTKPKKWQQELIRKHRNYGIDLVLIFHGFMDVPKSLRPHIWTWVIFRTPDFWRHWRDLEEKGFPNSRELYECWKDVEKSIHDPSKKMQYHRIYEVEFKSRLGQENIK